MWCIRFASHPTDAGSFQRLTRELDLRLQLAITGMAAVGGQVGMQMLKEQQGLILTCLKTAATCIALPLPAAEALLGVTRCVALLPGVTPSSFVAVAAMTSRLNSSNDQQAQQQQWPAGTGSGCD